MAIRSVRGANKLDAKNPVFFPTFNQICYDVVLYYKYCITSYLDSVIITLAERKGTAPNMLKLTMKHRSRTGCKGRGQRKISPSQRSTPNKMVGECNWTFGIY